MPTTRQSVRAFASAPVRQPWATVLPGTWRPSYASDGTLAVLGALRPPPSRLNASRSRTRRSPPPPPPTTIGTPNPPPPGAALEPLDWPRSSSTWVGSSCAFSLNRMRLPGRVQAPSHGGSRPGEAAPDPVEQQRGVARQVGAVHDYHVHPVAITRGGGHHRLARATSRADLHPVGAGIDAQQPVEIRQPVPVASIGGGAGKLPKDWIAHGFTTQQSHVVRAGVMTAGV